jgi:hypothetical protein
MVSGAKIRSALPARTASACSRRGGKEHGYAVKVTKTDGGYKVELTKQLAKN